MKHIVIFTQSPISKAPRVVKEANLLARSGYEVTLFAPWYSNEIVTEESLLLNKAIEYRPGSDLISNPLNTFFIKGIRYLCRLSVKLFNIQTKYALGYDYYSYLQRLKNENADLYIGHEEMSLALAKDLIQTGRKVAFDFEDYHSEDLLPKDRRYRPKKLLKEIESFVLINAIYCSTTSKSLANELAMKYNSKCPIAIYNSFYKNEISIENIKRKSNSLVWISQVIGPGRGVELLLDAICQARNSFNITLVGKKDELFCQNLTNRITSNHNLVISEYIPNDKIRSYLANYDLGIAFEQEKPKSRFLTITNKIFHYLNSGIAILATNTAGQIEVSLETENAIKIVSPDAKSIAKALDEIFDNQEILAKMKDSSRHFGQTKFSFETEESKILTLVENALVCS